MATGIRGAIKAFFEQRVIFFPFLSFGRQTISLTVAPESFFLGKGLLSAYDGYFSPILQKIKREM